MKKKITAVLVCILMLCAAAGYFIYRRKYAETVIMTSEHGGYGIRIVMQGDPEFPYGPVTCRADLYKRGAQINWAILVLYNDGKTPFDDQFSVEWQEERAVITAYPEETEPVTAELYFGGKQKKE